MLALKEGYGESVYLLGLVCAFIIVQKSHLVAQTAIECHFVRAAKALARLHICTSLTKPSSLYTIPCAAYNGDLCAIHASSEYSSESAHLRRHSHWTMRQVSRSCAGSQDSGRLHICTCSPDPSSQYRNLMCWL